MRTVILFLITAIAVLSSCNKQEHFITNDAYRKQVITDFEKTEELAQSRQEQLFSVFNNGLSLKEKEALMFLFAYMPLNDLADYDGSFFHENVQYAIKSQEQFKWGDDIPEHIFRHYVLPYRINNENLDSARKVFNKELYPRIKDMDMRQAVLEVNHWCHEKVTYKGTCERTISPLGAISSAYGRCGEESTFTVTALRSVGIPARQCYTPRWAHADDNHAWVEVWIDGDWYFIGACEPEADLNMAWFTGPALRAMMVHSRAFGKYFGNETVVHDHNKYAQINLLDHYAPVKNIKVKVIDENSVEVEKAKVEYQLYNYAEFYPLATKETNENGLSTFKTGFGDLLIWAYKDNCFAFQKITVEGSDTVVLKLKSQDAKVYTQNFHLVPPIERTPPNVSEDGRKENSRRLKEEDKIRTDFEGTFISEKEARELASNYKLNEDKLWQYLKWSRGNWTAIKKFIERNAKENPELCMELLNQLSLKDYRDTRADILEGHLLASKAYKDFDSEELFNKYILNPRIVNEVLIDYKSYLNQVFSEKQQNAFSVDILNLILWTKENIHVNHELNYYNVPISAKGVYELKLADSYSRDMFFVAACRTIGIPARLDPATKIPQYYKNGWTDVRFEAQEQTAKVEKGFIKLDKDPKMKVEPLYRIHFSLAKFENGRYNTLEYDWELPFKELGQKLRVETGNYMLITGNRQSDGSVLSNVSFFNVENETVTNVFLSQASLVEKTQVLGSYTLPKKLSLIDGTEKVVSSDETYICAWLDPEKEPTRHTLVDIEKVKSEFEKRNIPFVFFLEKKENVGLVLNDTYDLPENIRLFHDLNMSHLNGFEKKSGLVSGMQLPVFALVKNGQIYYYSKGYQIGIGEQMIKILNRIEE